MMHGECICTWRHYCDVIGLKIAKKCIDTNPCLYVAHASVLIKLLLYIFQSCTVVTAGVASFQSRTDGPTN